MMLGWRSARSVGRYVLLDPIFPWPALHHGREAMRIYATRQNKARLVNKDDGPMRMVWGLRASVKERGDAIIAVWPTDSRGGPRNWTPQDDVWKPTLAELAEFMAKDLLCDVKLKWMPGGEPFAKTLTVPSLQGVSGFYGWRKGENEPKASVMRRKIRDAIIAKQRQE